MPRTRFQNARRRTVRSYCFHKHAVGIIRSYGLSEVVVHVAACDSHVRVVVVGSYGDERTHLPLDGVRRYRKSDSLGRHNSCGGYPDDLPSRVQERTARIAWIYGGAELHDVSDGEIACSTLLNSSAELADYPFGHGTREPERIPYCDNWLAHL